MVLFWSERVWGEAILQKVHMSTKLREAILQEVHMRIKMRKRFRRIKLFT